MDVTARRNLLRTRTNPDQRQDYVVTLRGRLSAAGAGTVVLLRYVPDKLVIESESLNTYLLGLGGMAWDGLEDMAVTVLEDVSNETVARWVQVEMTAEEGDMNTIGHSVMLEDRQPKWDNPSLLARLGSG